MKRINIDLLQKGDIILTTAEHKISKVVRMVTNSDISHAMICISYGTIMDSTQEGVQARNLQRLFYPEKASIHILRTKTLQDQGVLDKIIQFARAATGTPYSKAQAVGTMNPFAGKGSSKMFCSRMVARAYASVGLHLVKNPDFCSPEDIRRSSLLEELNPASVTVSQNEIQFFKELPDQTEVMRNATNKLLKTVKDFAPSVEKVNDIDSLLLADPTLDARIASAYQASRYLECWEQEILIYPWRYDENVFSRLYLGTSDKQELLEYCEQTIADDKEGTFSHWVLNLKGYKVFYIHCPCVTFKLLIQLYEALILNQQKRVRCAKFILELHNLINGATSFSES